MPPVYHFFLQPARKTRVRAIGDDDRGGLGETAASWPEAALPPMVTSSSTPLAVDQRSEAEVLQAVVRMTRLWYSVGMEITKFGHCCLLIKEGALMILTDPGMYTTAQDRITGIDVVLITHEHQDHYHLESVRAILRHNPQAKVYTINSVGQLLAAAGVPFALLEHGQAVTEREVPIEAYGQDHGVIHPSWPRSSNTGYFINRRLWYPGDALTVPPHPVEILALPVAGPWLKLAEVIDFAAAIKPRQSFPVHDAMYRDPTTARRFPGMILQKMGIPFQVLELNKAYSL